MKRQIVAVTMGDPAGVGPEIVLKSCALPEIREKGIPLVVGDLPVLREVRDHLKIEIDLEVVDDLQNIKDSSSVINILDQYLIPDTAALPVGKVSVLAGAAAVSYIRKAVELASSGKVKGIVTAPINKEAVKAAGSAQVGHTELLAVLTKSRKSVTMFMVDRLKIFFHTRHMSLRKVIEALTIQSVLESIRSARLCLFSIGYERCSLALAALNPHASDGGLFGDEEERVLIPACRLAREEGIDVAGPVPADSVFHLGLEGMYDGIISLYHDQGHIAAKTRDFHRTVSVTFGLPFIRTSVDHGTAFNIAWKGTANPLSMAEALKACFDMSEKYRPKFLQEL